MNIKASTSEEWPIAAKTLTSDLRLIPIPIPIPIPIQRSRDPGPTNCQREFHKFRLESAVSVSGNGPHRVHYAHKRWHFRHWTEEAPMIGSMGWLWLFDFDVVDQKHTEICPAIPVVPVPVPPKSSRPQSMIGLQISWCFCVTRGMPATASFKFQLTFNDFAPLHLEKYILQGENLKAMFP